MPTVTRTPVLVQLDWEISETDTETEAFSLKIAGAIPPTARVSFMPDVIPTAHISVGAASARIT